jgi:uncharacterized coiled-coil DUF342 family protein
MNECNDPDHGAINAERSESRGLRKAWIELDDKRQELERELTTVTEQRDAVTLRLGNTQERMFDAERQRDRLAEAVNAATILIAAKGRHNTMLAYNGLRDALQSLTNQNEL